MQIDLAQPRQGVTVLALKGRLNLKTAPGFLDRVDRILDSGRRQVIVDLGEVELVDSSGVGALITATKRLRHRGGDLRIARPNRRMRVLLDVTFLNDMFRTYGDVEEALSDT